METLLDAVDELAKVAHPDRPDLDYLHLQDATVHLVLGDSEKGGKGWFASHDLPAGTTLLVSKPIAMIMGWEDEADGMMVHDEHQDVSNPSATESDDVHRMHEDNEDDNYDDEEENGGTENEEEIEDIEHREPEPRLNELLLLDILEALAEEPNIWFQQLINMFPRDDNDLSRLPAWVCPTDEMFLQVEEFLGQLRANTDAYSPEVVQEISKRLPHIIRYNVLSAETCSELLSYPGAEGHAALSGVALYHQASFFNHSPRPNCSRWAIGDIMFFVTNQNITTGQEVCISYIEHDVLCEAAYRRNRMLCMDFEDVDDVIGDADDNKEADDGPDMPVVDTDVQNELMSMDPMERLSAIEELLQQAKGEKLPADEEAMQEGSDVNMQDLATGWFQCDVQNLHILMAITLEGLGQTQKAMSMWQRAVHFAEKMLPPNDETSVVVNVQAALCALHAGDEEKATKHAKAALQAHEIIFGGGVRFFRRRYRADLTLQLRTARSDNISHIDKLWPIAEE